MNINDRIKKIREEFCDNSNKEFAEKLGVSTQYASNITKPGKKVGDKMMNVILEAFPGINPIWLKMGEGEMLKNGRSSEKDMAHSEKMIPFYDAEAAAGTSYGMDMSPVSRPSKMIRMGDFLSDSEAAIQVFGNSMTPNYPAGCIVGTKLHTDSFIEPGSVYVIETRDNRYIKRLYYSDDGEYFECESDNHMLYEDGARKGKPFYPMFKIPFDEVVRLHRVTGVIKRNII